MPLNFSHYSLIHAISDSMNVKNKTLELFTEYCRFQVVFKMSPYFNEVFCQ